MGLSSTWLSIALDGLGDTKWEIYIFSLKFSPIYLVGPHKVDKVVVWCSWGYAGLPWSLSMRDHSRKGCVGLVTFPLG